MDVKKLEVDRNTRQPTVEGAKSLFSVITNGLKELATSDLTQSITPIDGSQARPER